MRRASRRWLKRSRRATRGCSGFDDAGRHTHRRHSGVVRRTRPGIPRFSGAQLRTVVRCFASPRNDGEKIRMTTTTTDTPKPRIDFTRPVLWLFAAVMIVLILLPLSWLMV